MNNAAMTTAKSTQPLDVEPLLAKVFQEAEQEHQKLQDVFRMLGWGSLPDALKVEIKDDVAAMARELQGQYSSCDPFVQKRRERVTYWVDAYCDNICSLETAVDALRVTPL